MLEYLGVIERKELTGASIFTDKQNATQRIFAGSIGDIVVRDEKGRVFAMKADKYEQWKLANQAEPKKTHKKEIKEESLNV